MTTVSQARLGKWFEDFRAEHAARGFEEGLARGIEQGVAQGIAEGRARTLAMLRRLAAAKFDEQIAERLAGLLGGAAVNGQLERVGDWIMACDTGEALLARVSALAADRPRRP